MITKQWGNVKRLPDNTEAGYGPSYVSDRDGPLWVTYIVDCFDPPIYAFKCASLEEAYEHAEVVLCTPCPAAEMADYVNQGRAGHLASDEEVYNQLERDGWHMGPDGVWRATEALHLVEVGGKR